MPGVMYNGDIPGKLSPYGKEYTLSRLHRVIRELYTGTSPEVIKKLVLVTGISAKKKSYDWDTIITKLFQGLRRWYLDRGNCYSRSYSTTSKTCQEKCYFTDACELGGMVREKYEVAHLTWLSRSNENNQNSFNRFQKRKHKTKVVTGVVPKRKLDRQNKIYEYGFREGSRRHYICQLLLYGPISINEIRRKLTRKFGESPDNYRGTISTTLYFLRHRKYRVERTEGKGYTLRLKTSGRFDTDEGLKVRKLNEGFE